MPFSSVVQIAVDKLKYWSNSDRIYPYRRRKKPLWDLQIH